MSAQKYLLLSVLYPADTIILCSSEQDMISCIKMTLHYGIVMMSNKEIGYYGAMNSPFKEKVEKRIENKI